MQVCNRTRRDFLTAAACSLAGTALSCPPPILGENLPAIDAAPYETPYKLGKLVLSASTDPSAFDSRSVDGPFVFHAHDRFYMTYMGYDGTGYQTGLASSENLVDWKKLGCILHRNPKSPITRYNVAMNWIVRENQLKTPGSLKKIHGRYLGAYHAYPSAGYEAGPAVIGLCWSRDLMHWELTEPVLRPDDPNATAWEQGGLYKPCLVEDGGKFYLFYNAKTRNLPKAEGGGWHEQTGVATSADLKSWKRYTENPILSNGPRNSSWDDRFASDPAVFRNGKQWAMYYYGFNFQGKARDLLALGKDPFHFTKVGRIIIDVGPPGSVDETFAHKPSLVYHRGNLYHFYCAVSGKWPHEVRGISVARSTPWT